MNPAAVPPGRSPCVADGAFEAGTAGRCLAALVPGMHAESRNARPG